MKVNYVKIGVFTVLGLATAYGTYKLVKRIRERRAEKSAEVLTPEIEVQASNTSEKVEAKKPAFDGNKIVKKGSKNVEAKTVQTAFNNIIDDAKKVNLLTLKGNYKPTSPSSVSDWITEPFKAQAGLDDLTKIAERVKKIASIPKLTVDGNFGAKSVSACNIIMGTSETTYNKVKKKRIDFAKAYGLPSPY